MDRQTLRDWVVRNNEDGLTDRPRSLWFTRRMAAISTPPPIARQIGRASDGGSGGGWL